MALFTESQLSSVAYDLPENTTGAPGHANDQVQLQFSDGSNVTVFDKLTTGLRLLTFMRTNAQWQVAANDDITIVSINAMKGLLLENTLINQKLLTSFLPTYIGDQVRFVHRTMSTVLSLTDALKSTGFCHPAATAPYNNNLDLRFASTGIQLFDWNYEASPVDSTTGALLNDGNPAAIRFHCFEHQKRDFAIC